MTETADLNLVLGRIFPDDALHRRAKRHLRGKRLVAPFSVGIELLYVAHRFGLGHKEALAAMREHFEMESGHILNTAASALDRGTVPTLFDALHLADAFHRQGALHTADKRLHRTPFPTAAF